MVGEGILCFYTASAREAPFLWAYDKSKRKYPRWAEGASSLCASYDAFVTLSFGMLASPFDLLLPPFLPAPLLFFQLPSSPCGLDLAPDLHLQ
jgi:hypothetical protein